MRKTKKTEILETVKYLHKQNNTSDKHNKQDYQINIKQKAYNVSYSSQIWLRQISGEVCSYHVFISALRLVRSVDEEMRSVVVICFLLPKPVPVSYAFYPSRQNEKHF